MRILTGLIGIILEIYVAIHFNSQVAAFIDSFFGFTNHVSLFISQHLPTAKLVSFFPLNLFSGFISAPAHFLSEWLLKGISFLLLFMAAKIVVNIIGYLLTKSLDHTFIGHINRFLGGLMGAFFVGLVLGIVIYAASSILGTSDVSYPILSQFTTVFQDSRIMDFLSKLLK